MSPSMMLMAQQNVDLDERAEFLRMVQGWEVPLSLHEVRDLYIEHIVSSYDRRQAVRILGVGRTTLYRFLKKWNPPKKSPRTVAPRGSWRNYASSAGGRSR